MANPLFIPIHADALFLREGTLMTEPTADFSRLPFFNGKRDVNADVAPISENFVSPPLQNQNQRYPAGLHLHWSLPDALTKGEHVNPDDGSRARIVFPAVPNRWLVMRTGGGGLDDRQWIVESDYLWPEEVDLEDLASVGQVELFYFGTILDHIKLIWTNLQSHRQAPEPFLQILIDELSGLESQVDTALALFSDPEPAAIPLPPVTNLRILDYKNALAHIHDRINITQGMYPALQGLFAPISNAIQQLLPRRDVEPVAGDVEIAMTTALGIVGAKLNQLTAFLRWAIDVAVETKKVIAKRKWSISYPLASGNPALHLQPHRYLGRQIPAGLYDPANSAGFEYLDHLSAVGYGEPSFSAFYPNCRSVFGFHDEEIQPGTTGVTYHVVGWYSDEDKDFTKTVLDAWKTVRDNQGTFQHLENEAAKWSLEEELDPADFPEQMLCFSKLTYQAQVVTRADFVSEIQDGKARDIWKLLVEKDWIQRSQGRTDDPTQAIVLSGRGRQRLQLVKENILDTTKKDIERVLEKLQTPQFSDTAVTVANTGREALAAFLSYQLMPVDPALLESKKQTEAELKAAVLDWEEKKEKKRLGLIDESEVNEAEGIKRSLESDLTNIMEDIAASEVTNQPQRRRIEEQLEALFFADRIDDRQLDIGSKFREARHEQGFNAVATGQVWTIRQESDPKQTAQQLTEAARNEIPLDDSIASMLDLVNRLQQEYDQAHFRVEAQQEQLFTDWYKYVLSTYPPEDSRGSYPDIDEIRYFIKEKDLKPILEQLLQTGRLLLDHHTQPTLAGDGPGYDPSDHLKEIIQRELELENPFTIPEETTASRLKDAINHLLNNLKAHNYSTAKSLLKPADFKNWKGLIAILQEAPRIHGIKRLLSPEFQEALDTFNLQQMNDLALPANEPEATAFRDELSAIDEEELAGIAGRLNETAQRHDWRSVFNRFHQAAAIMDLRALLPTDTVELIDRQNAGQDPTPETKAVIRTAFNGTLQTEDFRSDPKPAGQTRDAITYYNRTHLEDLFPDVFSPMLRTKHVLKRITAPRYWEPREPAVLVTGEIARPSDRFARDGRQNDGLLNCFAPDLTLSDDFHNTSRNALISTIDGFRNAGLQDQIGYRTASSRPWNPLMLEWEVEVCPLQLGSNARDGDYDPDYILDNTLLRFNDEDLTVRSGRSKVTTGRNPNIYNGRSYLTAYAKKNMTEALDAYLEKNSNKTPGADFSDPLFTAQQAKERLNPAAPGQEGLQLLSQNLSGFNPALLMMKQTLQLPIEEPIGFQDYQEFTELVKTLVGDATKQSPQPLTDFAPIRSGELRLNQLRMVDTFGQYRQIDFFDPEDGAQVLGSSFTPAAVDGLESLVQIPLPNRLTQPARLNFRWQAAEADQEANTHQASSPICGWLVSNQLDISIVVFDAKGRSLGAVENEPDPGDSTRALWRPAPGLETQEDPAEIPNEHLRKVVEFLIGKGPGFVVDFINSTDEVLRTIEPEGFERQQALALLMGRPVAIVRAGFDLQMQGAPAVHHGWEAFYRDRQDGDLERETDLYTKVEVPIYLGKRALFNDGLVGYWIEEETNTDATPRTYDYQDQKFFLNAKHGVVAGVPEDGDFRFLIDEREEGAETIDYHPVWLSRSLDDPTRFVTMLVDPLGKVHATTGLLPVKEIDIPEDHYLPALEAIDITILTSPILTPPDKIYVPVPEQEGFSWCWLEKVKNNGSDAWREISTEPTITEVTFQDRLAEMLLQVLQDRIWLQPNGSGQLLRVANGSRNLLGTEFEALAGKLAEALNELSGLPTDYIDPAEEAERQSPTAFEPSDFNEKMKEAGQPAAELWQFLTNTDQVNWLRVYEVARVVPVSDRVKDNLEPEFPGLEPAVETILDAPTISKSEFFSRFADLLWQMMIRQNWLRGNEKTGFTLVPEADRNPLESGFEQLEVPLKALLLQLTQLTPKTFSRALGSASQPGGQLWALLTDTANQKWLEVLVADTAFIVPKERRVAKTLTPDFTGLEARIDDLFTRYHAGVKEPFLRAEFTEQRTTIREGWLKLKSEEA